MAEEEKKLVPDPDEEDQFERGRRNLMLRNAAAASRPVPPAPAGAAAIMPEAPNLVPSPPAEAALATPMTQPTKPPTYLERLQDQFERTYAKQFPERQPGYQKPTGWRRFGHIMSRVGEDIGLATVPNIIANIPGTRTYRERQLEALGKDISEEQERESLGEYRKAELPKIQAETERDLAEAAKARAEATGPSQLAAAEGGIWTNPDTQETLIGYGYGPKAAGGMAFVPPGQIPPTAAIPQPPPQNIPGAMPGIPTAAPQPARPGGAVPPGFQLGGPKAPTLEKDREKFIQLYNKSGRTPDEENFVQAHLPEFENTIPVGREKAAQMNREIAAMPGINPGLYTIGEGATMKDAKDLVAAARQAAELTRQVQAPIEAQDRKDKRTQGYAVNPDNNQLELTNRYVAENDWHTPFEEIAKGQPEKDKSAMRQLDDVQMNTTRYKNAWNAQKANISTNHALLMDQIINDQKIQAGTLANLLPGAEYVLNTLKDTNKASMWNTLDKTERDLVIAFLATKTSAIAYQRALTGSARSSETQLHLEMANIPAPYVGATVANDVLQRWQENVDQAASGYPHNLPGVEHPTAVRQRMEKQTPQTPAAPAAQGKGKGQWNPKTGKYE